MSDQIHRFVRRGTYAWWYLQVLIPYIYVLGQLEASQVQGDGMDDHVWEIIFSISVVPAGFIVGLTLSRFRWWLQLKQGVAHIAVLGMVSLLFLHLMHSEVFKEAFLLAGIPIFTVAGTLAYTISSFAGHHLKQRLMDRQGAGRNIQKPKEAFGKLFWTSVMASLVASGIATASGSIVQVVQRW